MIFRPTLLLLLLGASASPTIFSSAVLKLLANDGDADDFFGRSVAVYDGIIVVGAGFDDDKGTNSGSVYVFEKDNTGAYNQVAKLLANDGDADDRFGTSVAVSEGTIVVGSTQDDDKGSNSGSVYVFEKDGSGAYQQVGKLLANDGAAGDFFGRSVAVYDGIIVVGAYNDDDKGIDSGSAYVFEKDSTGAYPQVAKLHAIDGAASDFFGISVAVYDGTIVVGAYLDDDKGINSGSAYVFEKDGSGAYQQVAKLLADDGGAYDYFGISVAVSEETIVVGAFLDDDKGANSGSAYVFFSSTSSAPSTAPSTSPSKLQDDGDWEVATPAQFHYNDGAPSDPAGITEPTILIAFEHDDVTNVATTTVDDDAYGTIDVTHYEGGCTTVIEPGFGESEIGGALTQSPLVGSGTSPSVVARSASGLGTDYTLKLTNGVLTVIRYKLGLLDVDSRVTELIGGEYVTKFCTRLSLLALDADNTEMGFHELDVTVRHSVNSVTDVSVATSEGTTGPVNENFGAYSVRPFFATPGTPVTETTTPPDASNPLSQGEEFTIALVPQRTDASDTTADATEIDIISVDECFFWVDTNDDGLWIQGELRQYVVLDKEAVTTVTKDLTCSSAVIGVDDIDGCAFTVTLPTTFYTQPATTVKGVCTVTLEFDGSVRVRRQLQLSDGDQAQVSTLTELVVAGADTAGGAQEGNCWDGCFFLFCWINIIICWFQSIF